MQGGMLLPTHTMTAATGAVGTATWAIFANGILFEVVGPSRGTAYNRAISYANRDPLTEWEVVSI